MPQQPPEPTSGPLRSASRIFPLRTPLPGALRSQFQRLLRRRAVPQRTVSCRFCFASGPHFPAPPPPLTIFSNAAADPDCMTTIREIHSMNRRRISAVTRSPLFDPCGKMAKAGLLTRPPNDTFPVIRPVAPRRPVSWTHSSGTVADSHCVPF